MNDIYIHAYAGICTLGQKQAQIASALLSKTSPVDGGLSAVYSTNDSSCFIAQVPAISGLPKEVPQPFQNRNNALLYQVFLNIKAEWEVLSEDLAPNRMAVIVGSSNAGIEEGEKAVALHHATGQLPKSYCYAQQEYGSPAQFLAHQLGITGPAYTISTACSSSAKAFISAARLLQQNICDVVLVGGCDVLSELTVNGFMSLEAIDGGRCQPFANARKGIHLGEGGALFVLSRTPAAIKLRGWGESSDAYHMAAPQPEGLGAELSMRMALKHAKLTASDIDYINLHGTATLQNDAMEGAAVARVFTTRVPMSSTKTLTGHTLGAAGAIEALFCCMVLDQTSSPQMLPAHWIDDELDEQFNALNFVRPSSTSDADVRYVLSNSFGFGGSNASLIFEKVKP